MGEAEKRRSCHVAFEVGSEAVSELRSLSECENTAFYQLAWVKENSTVGARKISPS